MQGDDTWTLISDDISSDITMYTLNGLTANRVYEIEIMATTIERRLQSSTNTILATTSK